MYRTKFNVVEKLWYGPKETPQFNPKLSIGQAILRSLEIHGTKVAQISDDNGVQLTYGQLYLQTIRAAQNLQKLGLKKGDVVNVVSKNNHELAPIALAIVACGFVMSTMDPSFNEADMVHMMRITEPKLVFADLDAYPAAAAALKELNNGAQIYTFCGAVSDSVMVSTLLLNTGIEDEYELIEIDGEKETAIIVCTSGTTGPPKGVCLTHAILLDNFSVLCGLESVDVLLCFSPIYWLTGIWALFAGILFGAQRIITTKPFSVEYNLYLIEKYRTTFLMLTSFQLTVTVKSELIERVDFSHIKRIIVGGSKVSFDSIKRGKKLLPNGEISVAYGMSEIGGIATAVFPYAENDSVGRVRAGAIIKITDSTGNRLGLNEIGQICIILPYRMSGYYKNELATQDLYDSEGFLCSGDIGYFDDDGYLHVVDRQKEFVKYRNFMISPSEIEEFLMKLPEVKFVCVVGISDEESGDLPAAMVQLIEGKTISAEQISNLVAENFIDQKKLRGGVYFVNSFPMTSSGKVLRREVKKLATDLGQSADK